MLLLDVLLARISATNFIFQLNVRKSKLFKFRCVYFVKTHTFTSFLHFTFIFWTIHSTALMRLQISLDAHMLFQI